MTAETLANLQIVLRRKSIKVVLLNSAMMPVPGVYRARRIPKETFLFVLGSAYQLGQLESYLGYEQNVELIEKWTEGAVKLRVNREQVKELNDGDIMLVMKLNYRVQNPQDKGKEVSEDDFEFWYVEYEKEKGEG